MYNLNQQAFEKALEKEGEEEDEVCSIFNLSVILILYNLLILNYILE